jgi:hypothetical protein
MCDLNLEISFPTVKFIIAFIRSTVAPQKMKIMGIKFSAPGKFFFFQTQSSSISLFLSAHIAFLKPTVLVSKASLTQHKKESISKMKIFNQCGYLQNTCPWTNFSLQGEPWAEFTSFEVAACKPFTYCPV